ncbi:MAG: BolA family transcriptional regulator [Thermoanaerobaculales bacterium]|jgi:BolA protein|nr:BolA family transcriptional regulator [Thermoanaerobaculales bacterium]
MVRAEQRAAVIRDRLETELEAEHVEVVDDSRLHLGHPGAESGAGHFRVLVVSRRFEGVSRLAAQRLVYGALGELMVDDIHALEMRTLTPEQWRSLSP